MSNLPTNVAFKRCGFRNTFVNYDTTCLSVTAEDELIVNPKARFIVVPSAKHRGLIHIKSYYSNKFWRSRDVKVPWMFAAAASEPVEDVSSWNSTLFKVQYNHNHKYLMFQHCRNDSNNSVAVQSCSMLCSVNTTTSGTYFLPIDTDSIVKLPKRVTFNDKDRWVLCGVWQERHQYHKFCNDCIGNKAEYEIFYNEDGYIRVKSVFYNKFWRRSPNWIWADCDDTASDNPDTLFELVPLGKNAIALRNRGNNYFCIGLTTERKKNCLNAQVPNITREARLVVGEPVLSRDIKVHFRLNDATFRSERPLQVASVTVPNRTDKEHEIQQGFSYSKSKTTSWNITITVNAGVKTSIKSGLPFIADGKIEVSTEVSVAQQFGESTTVSHQVTSTYKVPAPAKTKTTVKLLATEAEYDIPFSYTQTDYRYDGKRVSTVFEDGMYHGVESYNFYYDTKYEPL